MTIGRGKRPLFCEPLLRGARRRLLLGRVEEDGRAVLRADVGPLAVQLRRVVAVPEDVEQRVVRDHRRVVVHLDDLGVAGRRRVQTSLYVGIVEACRRCSRRPSSSTPGILRNSSSTPQKQPAPNVAFAMADLLDPSPNTAVREPDSRRRAYYGHHGTNTRIRPPGPARASRPSRAPASWCTARFPTSALDHFDPFLLLDEMGPMDLGPGQAQGAPDHPHRGFETVTYLLDGRMEHGDSRGNRGRLGPGDVQWMTAGSGVVHSEMPEADFAARGGRMHGFQLWVNLPRKRQDDGAALPGGAGGAHSRRDAPTTARSTARVHRRRGARRARGDRHAHADRLPRRRRSRRARVHEQPLPADFNAFAYVVEGAGLFGAEKTRRPGRTSSCSFATTAARRAARGAGRRRPCGALAHRRPAARRAGRARRTLRHEHARRDRPGLRGLPAGPPRVRRRPGLPA